MNHDTTLYIREDLLERVDSSAQKLGVSRSRLISILLIKYMECNKSSGHAFTALKYQPRDTTAGYTTKNIYLRKDVYEMWCDVRKVFKLSASFIIALAVEKYLEEIINSGNVPHNYCSFYFTNVKYSQKACIITTLWGHPGKEKLKKLTAP